MGLKGKLVADVEVSSAEQVFNLFRHNPNQTSAYSENVQGCQLIQGKLGQQGSVQRAQYTLLDGKVGMMKSVVEVDEKTKSLRYTVVEGDALEDYKSMVVTLIAVSAGVEDADLIKYTIDYEKLNDKVPPPHQLMDMFRKVAGEYKVANVQAD